MASALRKADRPLLGNHQKSWLWGTHCIKETLLAAQWPVYELRLAENADQPIHREIEQSAQKAKVPVIRETAKRLEQLSKARDHQGVLALMGPFPYLPFEDLGTAIQPHCRIVILDRLQDPYNFGAILRSAAAFGVTAVLIGRNQQVGVTSHVARSSVGMVNRLPICRVDSLPAALNALKKQGLQILAAHQSGQTSPDEFKQSEEARKPLGILLGSEAQGIDEQLAKLCDVSVRIPMREGVESLNAAVSAGVLMYEFSMLRTPR